MATGIAIAIVDKFGRKPLLTVSALTMCASILTLGVFFYLDENKKCVYESKIVPDPCTNMVFYLRNPFCRQCASQRVMQK